jgi:CrcB protein
MLELQKILFVGLGGSLGAMLRYFIARIFVAFGIAGNFPTHTLVVNLAGCFLIGLFSSVFPNVEENQLTRLFLLTGIIGGFTTFSAFSIETIDLIRNGSALVATAYVASSVIVGLVAVAAGSYFAESLR